jgi:hypothetical protein
MCEICELCGIREAIDRCIVCGRSFCEVDKGVDGYCVEDMDSVFYW